MPARSPTAWSSATEKLWSEWNAVKMWVFAKVCEGLICPVYRDGSEMISITKDQVCVHVHTPSAVSLSTPSVVSEYIDVLQQESGWLKH